MWTLAVTTKSGLILTVLTWHRNRSVRRYGRWPSTITQFGIRAVLLSMAIPLTLTSRICGGVFKMQNKNLTVAIVKRMLPHLYITVSCYDITFQNPEKLWEVGEITNTPSYRTTLLNRFSSGFSLYYLVTLSVHTITLSRFFLCSQRDPSKVPII